VFFFCNLKLPLGGATERASGEKAGVVEGASRKRNKLGEFIPSNLSCSRAVPEIKPHENRFIGVSRVNDYLFRATVTVNRFKCGLVACSLFLIVAFRRPSTAYGFLGSSSPEQYDAPGVFCSSIEAAHAHDEFAKRWGETIVGLG
jgi:hypothetical protein